MLINSHLLSSRSSVRRRKRDIVVPQNPVFTATGGTITEDGTYRYHTFTSSGTLNVTVGGTVEYLVVAGGGGGGRHTINSGAGAAGGGGGGVRNSVADDATLSLTAGSYTITVGAGGAGGLGTGSAGYNGQNSSISTLIESVGGGGGGNPNASSNDGGSGGGGAGSSSTLVPPGKGTPGQGFDGGLGFSSATTTDRASGGGGGAGGWGQNATTGTGGNGGPGESVWGTYYSAGGGGVGGINAGLGGTGGGGAGQKGGTSPNADINATCYGGGGGAVSASNTTFPAGAGKEGIVIIRTLLSGSTPVPTIYISNATVSESAGSIVFTVTRTGDLTDVSSVSYSTSDGTAVAASDYVAKTGTVSFSEGQSTRTISIDLVNDATVESNETFYVTLSNPINAAISNAQATGTITNDDSAVSTSVTINNVSTAENVSPLVFTVTRSGDTTGTSSVDYSTANASAIAGSDYTAASGTLTFTAGQTSKTISITILNDATVENNETFYVNLSNPVNCNITNSQGVGTITNDDTAPDPTGDYPAPTITLNSNYGYNQYKPGALPANSVIKATGSTWIINNSKNSDPTPTNDCNVGSLTTQVYPIEIIDAGAGLYWYHGKINGIVPQDSDWSSTYCGSATSFRFLNCPGAGVLNGGPTVRDVHIDRTWDGIRFIYSNNWTVQGVYATYVRDDFIEDDVQEGGIVKDCLIDGFLNGIACDPSSNPNQISASHGQQLIQLDGVLMRHRKTWQDGGKFTHGCFFKYSTDAAEKVNNPRLLIKNCVLAIEDVNHNNKSRLTEAWSKLETSGHINNFFLNLSNTPLPSSYPKPPAHGNFTILEGQAARDKWDQVKADWLAAHPHFTPVNVVRDYNL